MDTLSLAEHHAAALVVMAVIILVNRSVPRVRVPGFPVLVKPGIPGFIVLEQRVLAFPGPDSRRHHAAPFSRIRVNFRIDILRRVKGNIILDQRPETIHGRDRVSPDGMQPVMLDLYIHRTICPGHLVRNLQGSELIMLIGISCRDPPSPAAFHPAVMDRESFVSCDPGLVFLCRFQRRYIDTAVIHVFIVNVPGHIVDIQPVQFDLVQRPAVSGDHADSRPVHPVALIIRFTLHLNLIGDLQVPQGNIFRVIQEDCR